MRRATLLALVALSIAAAPAAAQSDGGISLAEQTFPENNEVRSGLEEVIRAPAFEAAQAPAGLYTEEATGLKVRFSVVTEGEGLYLLFVNQSRGAFAIENPGSWVIKRSAVDGSFLQAKIFLNGDPGSFARLFPARNRTRMDLYLYGYPIYRDVIIPIDFHQLLTEPITRIMDATRSSVEWRLVLPRPPLPEDRMVERMVGAAPAIEPGLLHGCDIRSVPFLRFTVGHGYPVSQLALLLYLLAMREPGFYYVGTFSPPPELGGAGGKLRGKGAAPPVEGAVPPAEGAAPPATAGSSAASPGARQAPPVMLFPYFDGADTFTVAAIEQGRRISLEQLVRREGASDICLERIRAPRNLDHPSVD